MQYVTSSNVQTSKIQIGRKSSSKIKSATALTGDPTAQFLRGQIMEAELSADLPTKGNNMTSGNQYHTGFPPLPPFCRQGQLHSPPSQESDHNRSSCSDYKEVSFPSEHHPEHFPKISPDINCGRCCIIIPRVLPTLQSLCILIIGPCILITGSLLVSWWTRFYHIGQFLPRVTIELETWL